MKKILTVFLALCLIAAFGTMFAISSFAEEATEEIDVTAGMKFEWNDSSENAKQWIQSKGVSPEGLWKYQMYALEKGIYQDLAAVYSSGFAISTNPGDDGVGYARVRKNGINFHPGKTADVVKAFTCPSGGTIEVTSVLTREKDVSQTGTGTSFCVYLGSQLVYPADGSPYMILNSKDPQTFTFTVDVAKGQVLRFHIGGIDGNIAGDSTNMSNVVTYKAVNDSVGEDEVSGTITFDRVSNTVSVDAIGANNGNNGSSLNTSNGGNGGNVGLIIGIVAGVVVVAAVVVVVIIKKKQQY